MAYGMMIRRQNGTMWMSPDVTPLTFQGRMDITFTEGVGGVWNTSVPQDRPFMAFARSLKNANSAWSSFQYIKRNGVWAIKTHITSGVSGDKAASIRFYIFSNIPKQDSNYGVAFRNAQGQLTWTGDSLPLQLTRHSIPQTVNSINLGYTCATIPAFSDLVVEGVGPGVPPIYMYGSYAFMASGNEIFRKLIYFEETTGEYPDLPSAIVTYSIKTELYDL